jgi:hypothetical protein
MQGCQADIRELSEVCSGFWGSCGGALSTLWDLELVISEVAHGGVARMGSAMGRPGSL